jgi:thioredoxin 1
MLSKRTLLHFAGAGVASMLVGPSHAATQTGFDQARFDAARASGAPVLVFVAAEWCPTCRVQAPLIAQIGAEPAFARLQIFRLDFDAQKVQRRALRASRQSTIIAFKGGVEVGRSVGATNVTQIRALMQLTIT